LSGDIIFMIIWLAINRNELLKKRPIFATMESRSRNRTAEMSASSRSEGRKGELLSLEILMYRL